MKKIKKYSLFVVLALALVFSPMLISAASDIVVKMGGVEVTRDEEFVQSRLDSKGQGLIDLANAQILNKDYSYEKNKTIKNEIDKQIKEMKDSGTDYVAQYGVKDELELLKKSGAILQAQSTEYAKQTYYKEYVTDKTLKKLYDQRKGELTSYSVIKIDQASFDDPNKATAAVTDIETQLSKATEKDVKAKFAELAKKYQTSDETNGEQSSVDRENVEEGLLKIIDSYKYMQFSKKAVEIDGTQYFILKTDKGERPSFEASKEKLKDLQFQDATQNNQYLEPYLLMKLREKHKITFNDKADQKVYEAANKQIEINYQKAEEGETE